MGLECTETYGSTAFACDSNCKDKAGKWRTKKCAKKVEKGKCSKKKVAKKCPASCELC